MRRGFSAWWPWLFMVAADLRMVSAATSKPDPSDPVTLILRLKDGSQVMGRTKEGTLQFKSSMLGLQRIPIRQLDAIRWTPGQTNALLQTRKGDQLNGVLAASDLRLITPDGETNVLVNNIAMLLVARDRTGARVDLSRGLVARWSADGDASDSFAGHHGEVLFGVPYAPGVKGQAFKFGGARSRIAVPDSPAFELTKALTLAMWVKVEQFPAIGAASVLFMRGDLRPGLDPYALSLSPEGRMRFSIVNDENLAAMVQTRALTLGHWTHVVAILTEEAVGRGLSLYVDGRLAAHETTPIIPLKGLVPTAQAGMGIGNHSGVFHNFPFQGLIDEVHVYSRGLSEAEVRALHLNASPVSVSKP